MKNPYFVVDNKLCAGCGFCENLFTSTNLKMKYNEFGFLVPNVNKNLKFSNNELNIFNNVCPSLNAHISNTKDYNVLLGPIKRIMTGYSADETIRYKGSSGGVLSTLAIYLLENNLVNAILHIGADEENPLINKVKISQNRDQVVKNIGSRYSPSAPLININEVLGNFDSICFIGKPCDAMAIRNYMKVNQEAKNKVKYILSFMCAGIPSLDATKNILKKLDFDTDKIKSIKYRGDGWPGYFKVENFEGKVAQMSYNESWGTILNKSLQFRCKICADGTGEFADLTCADSWDKFNNGYPTFEDSKGKSLIISRTQNGDNLIINALREKYIRISENNINIAEVVQMQPYQIFRKIYLLPRILAMSILGRKHPPYNNSLLIKASLKGNPISFVKNFGGMVMRILKAKSDNRK